MKVGIEYQSKIKIEIKSKSKMKVEIKSQSKIQVEIESKSKTFALRIGLQIYGPVLSSVSSVYFPNEKQITNYKLQEKNKNI